MKYINEDKAQIRKYYEAYEKMTDFIYANDPINEVEIPMTNFSSPVLLEDEIYVILGDQPENAVIDIVAGVDDCDDSEYILRVYNSANKTDRDFNMYLIYFALKLHKTVRVNDIDITTIDFEY